MNKMPLDEPKLTAWLEQNLIGFAGPLRVEKFNSGQSNPTYKLSTLTKTYVLRRKPPGPLLKSAHAVDREFRVMRALHGSKVPVPQVLALCEDDSVIGSIFYVMAHVEGRIFWDPTLPDVAAANRAAYYDAMNKALADLHSLDLSALGLSDYGKTGAYFERQFSRWREQYRASELQHHVAMEKLIDWLAANMPPDDGRVSLVHGDYRVDNMIFDAQSPHILALLDWELSTLGHPFADLAYQCMQWRMPYDSEIKGLGGLNRAALGLPSEQDYVAAYAQRMGLGKIEHWPFYLAFSFFRFAAILQGVIKRAEQGNASNPAYAKQLTARVPQLAQMALEVISC